MSTDIPMFPLQMLPFESGSDAPTREEFDAIRAEIVELKVHIKRLDETLRIVKPRIGLLVVNSIKNSILQRIVWARNSGKTQEEAIRSACARIVERFGRIEKQFVTYAEKQTVIKFAEIADELEPVAAPSDEQQAVMLDADVIMTPADEQKPDEPKSLSDDRIDLINASSEAVIVTDDSE